MTLLIILYAIPAIYGVLLLTKCCYHDEYRTQFMQQFTTAPVTNFHYILLLVIMLTPMINLCAMYFILNIIWLKEKW